MNSYNIISRGANTENDQIRKTDALVVLARINIGSSVIAIISMSIPVFMKGGD
ncbi:MAG: hypothetical protein WC297_02995 [Candidatus Paceibacterota bacterium]